MVSKSPRSKDRKKINRVDVGSILTKPVKVGQNGRVRHMPPYEIELRALVKKALKEGSLNAIKTLIDVALKHDLCIEPQTHIQGGVLVVPGRLTKESWAELFEAPTTSNPETNEVGKAT